MNGRIIATHVDGRAFLLDHRGYGDLDAFMARHSGGGFVKAQEFEQREKRGNVTTSAGDRAVLEEEKLGPEVLLNLAHVSTISLEGVA